MLYAGKVPTVQSAENGVAIVPIQHPIILFFTSLTPCYRKYDDGRASL